MKSIYLASFLIKVIVIKEILSCKVSETTVEQKDWWQTAQFYQIYPRSFKDSDGDGIGDLNGITSKLDHLTDIGVTATWLSPIYKSPMADFGYDISSFYEIQEEYGTMDDFDNLISNANARGIKIILDFVPNHSSDENVWFEKSVNREKGWEDFFVWHDGYEDSSYPNGRRPPSNWLQAFRGSAWEWNDKRQQFYLHQFAVKQPDLNYRNPVVVETMKGVLRYWLRKGVAGFRVDAVPWCFEALPDANGNYLDEPLSNYTNDPEESAYLKHIYTQDQPETVDMVYQWRQVLDDFQRIHGGDTRVLMIETYSPLDYVMKMYGNATTKGAQIPFNFQFILNGNKDSSVSQLVSIIDLWLKRISSSQTPNWVMGNHDQRRVGSRYGEQNIDTMNMIQMFMPGVSVTYNGEEIGMLDGNISWEDSRDPAACNSNSSIYEKFTRDPERTPFQWDNTANAGFSTNSTTWLPINPNYVTINVKTEKANTRSHLNVYKSLVSLRKTKTLMFGDLKYGAINNNVLGLKRSLSGQSSYVMVANFKGNTEIINLRSWDSSLPTTLSISVASVTSSKTVGSTVSSLALTLAPNEALILVAS